MTPDSSKLREIAERLEKTTKGPWAVQDPMGPEILSIVADEQRHVYEWKHVAQIGVDVNREDDEDEKTPIPPNEAEANADFIAHAPTDIAFLLSALRRMELENAELRSALEVSRRYVAIAADLVTCTGDGEQYKRAAKSVLIKCDAALAKGDA